MLPKFGRFGRIAVCDLQQDALDVIERSERCGLAAAGQSLAQETSFLDQILCTAALAGEIAVIRDLG